MRALKSILRRLGMLGPARLLYGRLHVAGNRKRFLVSLPIERRRFFLDAIDPVRLAAIGLAIDRIRSTGIDGAFAEVGVWRGDMSRVIHSLAPDRRLYLFDTFAGFPASDLEGHGDLRFRDTNVEAVKKNIGDLNNVCFRPGYFPETARGLEDQSFAFVLLDVDLYSPTRAGLEFFYPRLSSGGYLFVHDYNSPESDWAVSRAVNEFMTGRVEKLVEIPDAYGSVIIRKA